MPRLKNLILIIIMFSCVFSLYAQYDNEPEDNPDEEAPEWIDIISAPFSKGDKNFVISLGGIFPTVFTGVVDNQHGLSIGGCGSLALNYFFTDRFFIGGEIMGMFAGTRAGNMLYIIPFGLRVGYQFWYKRFEFPISILIGAAPQRYVGKDYFGLILKPGVSAFWRFNTDWSFGLNGEWMFVPEWPKNGNNAIGNFLELTLSARYHF